MKTTKEERKTWVEDWKHQKTQYNSKIAHDVEELECTIRIAKSALRLAYAFTEETDFVIKNRLKEALDKLEEVE